MDNYYMLVGIKVLITLKHLTEKNYVMTSRN